MNTALALLGFFATSMAFACPDFSGKFQAQTSDGMLLMTQDQTGCESLRVHSTLTPSAGNPVEENSELFFDGVLRQIDPEAGMDLYRFTYWDGDAMIVSLVGITPDATHPGFKTRQTRCTLDSDRNFVTDSTWYDAAGKTTKTARLVYTRVP